MTPEAKARQQIDDKLARAGWVVQDMKALNLGAATGVAVREYPTDTGPADYVLFVDRRAVGVIEAKRDEAGENITAIRDPGVKDIFEKDRTFKATTFHPADKAPDPRLRARICKLFETALHHPMDREDHAIADAVSQLFPAQARRLREVLARLSELPGPPPPPDTLARLGDALDACIARSRQTRPTVQLVKKRLDALLDGIQLLNVYEAELTADAIQAVRRAADVRDHALIQLEAAGVTGTEAAGAHVRAHLSAERPWRDIGALHADLAAITAAYVEERRARLAHQEQQAEHARIRIKLRPGFATLTADQSHHVLRPIAQACTDTTADAIAPTLVALRDPFAFALQRAEATSNERLDELLSDKKLVVRLDLGLHNREVSTEAEVDTLLAELRARLVEKVRSGARVRLV